MLVAAHPPEDRADDDGDGGLDRGGQPGAGARWRRSRSLFEMRAATPVEVKLYDENLRVHATVADRPRGQQRRGDHDGDPPPVPLPQDRPPAADRAPDARDARGRRGALRGQDDRVRVGVSRPARRVVDVAASRRPRDRLPHPRRASCARSATTCGARTPRSASAGTPRAVHPHGHAARRCTTRRGRSSTARTATTRTGPSSRAGPLPPPSRRLVARARDTHACVISRFAPSTTGEAHPGTLLSALLVWLDARARGGRVVLRLEDLDTTRDQGRRGRPQLVEACTLARPRLGRDHRSRARAAPRTRPRSISSRPPAGCIRARAVAGRRAPAAGARPTAAGRTRTPAATARSSVAGAPRTEPLRAAARRRSRRARRRRRARPVADPRARHGRSDRAPPRRRDRVPARGRRRRRRRRASPTSSAAATSRRRPRRR